MGGLEVGYLCSFTVDRVIYGGAQWLQPGGPAIYSSVAARCVGLEPVVYSAVGFDFEEAWLRRLGGLGVQVEGVGRFEGELTTMFTVVFEGGARRLYVFNRLSLDEYFRRTKVAQKWLYASFTFGDVGAATLEKIVEGREVFLDLQGHLRVAEATGLVRPAEPKIGFKGLKYLKLSRDECLDLDGLVGRALKEGVSEVVVTEGGRGATVYGRDGRYFCPALAKPASQLATLGAGDVFGSVYFAYRLRGFDVAMALSAGAIAAAKFVRRRSPNPFFGFAVGEDEARRVADRKLKVWEKQG